MSLCLQACVKVLLSFFFETAEVVVRPGLLDPRHSLLAGWYPIEINALRDAFCIFPSIQEAGGRSYNLFAGMVSGAEEKSLFWCSRIVDSYRPMLRPKNDTGTHVYTCANLTDCELLLTTLQSGTIGLLQDGADYLLLADDRISYTTVALRLNASGREVGRGVALGWPDGWRVTADGGIRILQVDGRVLSLDRQTMRMTTVVQPFDSGGL